MGIGAGEACVKDRDAKPLSGKLLCLSHRHAHHGALMTEEQVIAERVLPHDLIEPCKCLVLSYHHLHPFHRLDAQDERKPRHLLDFHLGRLHCHAIPPPQNMAQLRHIFLNFIDVCGIHRIVLPHGKGHTMAHPALQCLLIEVAGGVAIQILVGKLDQVALG